MVIVIALHYNLTDNECLLSSIKALNAESGCVDGSMVMCCGPSLAGDRGVCFGAGCCGAKLLLIPN